MLRGSEHSCNTTYIAKSINIDIFNEVHGLTGVICATFVITAADRGHMDIYWKFRHQIPAQPYA